MDKNTRIYNRWQGYTVADCACELCRWYDGKKRLCLLESCCCAEEREEALLREQAAIDDARARENALLGARL